MTKPFIEMTTLTKEIKAKLALQKNNFIAARSSRIP